MKKIFLKYSGFLKLFYCLLLTITFFYCPNSIAQQKTSGNKKIGKSDKSDIRYGVASFYADKFNGRKTASGQIFSQNKLTCACNVLPLGTWVKVTNMSNGKSVKLLVNDRLHPRMRRLVDLSKSAAIKLGFISSGLVKVKLEVLYPNK
jgi:rare lipoprotein A